MNRQRLGWLGTAALFGIGIGVVCAPVWGRMGVVKTKDGRSLEGDITEKPDEVVISIRGIQTKMDPMAVSAVEYFDNVEARYKDRLAKLPKNASAKDHVELGRWLLEMKSFDNAMREVDEARRIEPNNAEAAALDQTITSQRRIDRNRPAAGVGAPPAAGGVVPAAGGAPAAGAGNKPGEKHLLTADDINTIRQIEWKDNDTVAPRVTVPGGVRTRYVTMKALNAAEFAALTPQQQAYKILSDADTPPEMRKEIKVITDPVSLADYRRTVQPMVINSCATIGCHGGQNAGKFFLFNTNVERDDVAYTNFYLLRLQKYSIGDKTYQLIDPQYENLSVLGQFALPADAAELHHPEVKAHPFKPLAANKASPNYVKLVTWMKNLVAGEPRYGITYSPTGAAKGAATPAPDPATPKVPAGKGATPAIVPAGTPAVTAPKR